MGNAHGSAARLSTGWLGGLNRRIAWAAVMALLALGLGTPSASSGVVLIRYAGWSPVADKNGIRGYIRQPDSGTVTDPDVVASYVGLCGYGCTEHAYVGGGSGYQWVQLGVFQGWFKNGYSPNVPHVYAENVDPCGNYYADDFGAPVSTASWFRVAYDDNGSFTSNCAGGVPFTAYEFVYKQGSSQAADWPFFWGVMGTNDGRADAATEIHNAPSEATVHFGCLSTSTCIAESGIEVESNSGWVLCCTNVESRGPHNPPYRNTIENYWAFKTCQNSC